MNDDLAAKVAKWQPKSAPDTFLQAFQSRCKYEEDLLLARAQFELETRLHNFSSGPPIEALVRDFFRRILPGRYAVDCGHVMDLNGRTAGECDIVIHNDTWFPSIRARVSEDDRYYILGAESVYAALEVKQTLDLSTLEQAMEKLVICSRLGRERRSFAATVAENRYMDRSDATVGNPLFTGIVAVRLGNCTQQELIERFVEINRLLDRDEMVRSICVLGEWTSLWGYRSRRSGTNVIASFIDEDLTSDIKIGLATKEHGNCPLSVFSAHLIDSVTLSTLCPWQFAENYGAYTAPKLADSSYGFTIVAPVPG